MGDCAGRLSFVAYGENEQEAGLDEPEMSVSAVVLFSARAS